MMTDMENGNSVIPGLQAEEGYSTLVADRAELKGTLNYVNTTTECAALEDVEVQMPQNAVGWSKEDSISFYGSVV